jgi:hypothetical protein
LFELSVDLADTKDEYRYVRPATAELQRELFKIFERTLLLSAIRRRLHIANLTGAT